MVVSRFGEKPQQNALNVNVIVLRWHSVQAEGLPGLLALPAAERGHPGPGGEGHYHPRGPARLPGTLQQLRLAVHQRGPLPGEAQGLCL